MHIIIFVIQVVIQQFWRSITANNGLSLMLRAWTCGNKVTSFDVTYFEITHHTWTMVKMILLSQKEMEQKKQ